MARHERAVARQKTILEAPAEQRTAPFTAPLLVWRECRACGWETRGVETAATQQTLCPRCHAVSERVAMAAVNATDANEAAVAEDAASQRKSVRPRSTKRSKVRRKGKTSSRRRQRAKNRSR